MKLFMNSKHEIQGPKIIWKPKMDGKPELIAAQKKNVALTFNLLEKAKMKKKINVFFVERQYPLTGSGLGSIYVSNNLVSNFSDDVISAAIGHEIGHLAKHHNEVNEMLRGFFLEDSRTYKIIRWFADRWQDYSADKFSARLNGSCEGLKCYLLTMLNMHARSISNPNIKIWRAADEAVEALASRIDHLCGYDPNSPVKEKFA